MSEQNTAPLSSAADIARRLAEPFDAVEVKWKPQSVKGNRALAIAYIDARLVMDRLDEVFGVDGWEDAYECLPDGNVRCRLTVHFPGGRTVTKSDVGGESEQPDDGDKAKAAHSDSLKRTAVKYGIGRYLYSLPHQWCDYDPAKRGFSQPPKLPHWAIPAQQAPPVAAIPPAKPKTEKPTPAPVAKPDAALPEWLAKLHAFDAKLVESGLATKGQLLTLITEWGVKVGHGDDLAKWPEEAITEARAKATAFSKLQKQQAQTAASGGKE